MILHYCNKKYRLIDNYLGRHKNIDFGQEFQTVFGGKQ